MDKIYLDNAATTPVDEKVMKAMQPYFSEKFGNASSQHSFGFDAKNAMEDSREIIAKSIRAKPSEIYFTSGGTEANNWALKGVIWATGKKHLITTKIEHDCVLNASKWLESRGIEVTYLDVDEKGFVNPKDVENAIKDETAIVSIIHGNNEIGTIQDIGEIGKICKEKGVLFHTDACQSYTKVPINVKKQDIDLITLNAHKIHGPKGVGVLYVRDGIKITPLLHGGGHEEGLRSGTENIPGIVGFAKASKIAKSSNVKYMKKLQDKLINGILQIEGIKLNGPEQGDKRLCNNINLLFDGASAETIGEYLDAYGISSSVGSACSAHSKEPSHVLRAIGLSDKEARSSIRLSLSKLNTHKEIDRVLELMPKIVENSRKIGH